jgi:hypothetical protein
MTVYESNPEPEDDSRFVPGELAYLVAGNRGRLLDARRTPISVLAVDDARGSFIVRIEAFEDRGACWELGLEEVERFQFSRDARTAGRVGVAQLAEARQRFNRHVHIEPEAGALDSTLRAIAAEQQQAAEALKPILPGLEGLDIYASRRNGEPQLWAALNRFLTERDLAALEDEFSGAFVSNPGAGELVKAHAMVLARLGLCPFDGKVLRDPAQLRAPWSTEVRARHLVARLGFMRALWAAWGIEEVMLYRAAASEGPLDPGRTGSWVSATFSREVAEAHFEGGPTTRASAIWRQLVPVERMFMTFLETPAMNERFLEAEAVLVGDPAAPAF